MVITMEEYQKTKWFSYILSIITFFFLSLGTIGYSSLNSTYFGENTFMIYYAVVSAISLILGIGLTFILNQVVGSAKTFFWGYSIVSFSPAIIIVLFLSTTSKLSQLITGTLGSSTSLLDPLSALITGSLTILFFNVFPIIMFLKEKGPIKDLAPYLYSLILTAILYFTIPSLILNLPL